MGFIGRSVFALLIYMFLFNFKFSTGRVNNVKSENGVEGSHEIDEKFPLSSVPDYFTKCYNNSLDMDHYISGFKQLYRFLSLLGKVLEFVASDIGNKVNILEGYRNSENATKYATIQSMIEHERSSGIANDTSRPSGTQTLLRLHRFLEFIVALMRDMSLNGLNDQSSGVIQKCYQETLAKHHDWLTKKAAMLLMYTLPSGPKFCEKVHGEPCDEDTRQFYKELMHEVADASKKVYDETHKLYEAHELLDLA